MQASHIKPTHKAIQDYYAKLEGYGAHDVTHEMGLRSAFQQLLESTGKMHKWTLVPEQSLKVRGKTVRPDGTFRDEWHLPCGYWEAKDTRDDLDAEVRAKAANGYPLTNTIFEDTRQAILFQNGRESFRIPLSDRNKLADLPNHFYGHAKPDIETFKAAVEHFKERIPDLARGLNERIVEAHKNNPAFKAAFAEFFKLCQNSLNPNIRFHYVYGVLHHPGYRTRFADNLKRELARIPFMDNFRAFAKAGKKLVEPHVGYESLEPWPLEWVENRDVHLPYHVEKMRLSKDKTELKVNESLTLAKIPPEVFHYRLGNRSALEWVIDQYQISEDKRSCIHSDPNREDDPEYIVRLGGQVVRVSMETVKLVDNLPPAFGWPEKPG